MEVLSTVENRIKGTFKSTAEDNDFQPPKKRRKIGWASVRNYFMTRSANELRGNGQETGIKDMIQHAKSIHTICPHCKKEIHFIVS